MNWFESLTTAQTPWPRAALGLALLALAALLLYLIARRYVLRGMRLLIDRSSIHWDGTLFENRVPHRLALFVPLIVLDLGMVWVPGLSPAMTAQLDRVISAGMFGVSALTLAALLSAGHTLYLRSTTESGRNISTYVQLTKLIVYLVATVFVVARLLDESPWYFMSGLGAILAVVLLIFRDTILSVVASIQVAHLDLVRVGDRIEMANLGADGDVVDVALTAVKVRNLDRTITIIPTHRFMDQSFRNWRSMVEGGGRRIMRSIPISITSIRFLTEEEVAALRGSQELGGYVGGEGAPDRPTNLGALRARITAYLRAHPSIRDDLPVMVRQLEPTPDGLPLQVYAFAADTRLVEYEAIQAEIFDWILPLVGEFGLEIYQRPTGRDVVSAEGAIGQLGGGPGAV